MIRIFSGFIGSLFIVALLTGCGSSSDTSTTTTPTTTPTPAPSTTPTAEPSTTPTPTPLPTALPTETPVYGCNHPDATNYDPTVTDYVPGSCEWPGVDGLCGTANRTFTLAETGYGAETFCAAGTASPAAPAYPTMGTTTQWSCVGENGGTTATCQAYRRTH